MKRVLFLFISALAFGAEEFQQVKVLNGFEASCDKVNEEQVNNNRPVGFNVLESKKQGSSYLVKLELIFLKCDKNKWQASSQQSFNYQYTDTLGQKIEESLSFSKYKLDVLGKNESVIYSSDLRIEGQSKYILNLKINSRDVKSENSKSGKKFVEISLSAEKTRKNVADIEPTAVNWGKLNLSF